MQKDEIFTLRFPGGSQITLLRWEIEGISELIPRVKKLVSEGWVIDVEDPSVTREAISTALRIIYREKWADSRAKL